MSTDPELWADHADNDAELLRIRALPERVQRGLCRLVVRCPHNQLVLSVYEVGGLLLAVAATDDASWRSVAGRHGSAWWLSPGGEFGVRCRRGPYYPVSSDRVLAVIPSGGTRNVGVSTVAPIPAVP